MFIKWPHSELHCRDKTPVWGDLSPDSTAEAQTAPGSGNHTPSLESIEEDDKYLKIK